MLATYERRHQNAPKCPAKPYFMRITVGSSPILPAIPFLYLEPLSSIFRGQECQGNSLSERLRKKNKTKGGQALLTMCPSPRQ